MVKRSTGKDGPRALINFREPGSYERQYAGRRRGGPKRCGQPDRPGGRAGRRPGLDDVTQRVIVTALERGNRIPVAAVLAGVPVRTMWRWLEWGAEDPPAERIGKDNRLYRAFRIAVEEARAVAEARAVESISAHIPNDPETARWFLRQTHPDWNRDRVPMERERQTPETTQQPVVQATIIHVDMATLHEIARQQVAKGRETPDGGDDDRRASLARLVTDQ